MYRKLVNYQNLHYRSSRAYKFIILSRVETVIKIENSCLMKQGVRENNVKVTIDI